MNVFVLKLMLGSYIRKFVPIEVFKTKKLMAQIIVVLIKIITKR